jgi:hypothetical protein
VPVIVYLSYLGDAVALPVTKLTKPVIIKLRAEIANFFSSSEDVPLSRVKRE